MAPFPVSNLKVTVTSVQIDATGKATVDWSDTLNGTARAKGSTVTLPAALNVANTSLIWSEVQYSYKPVIGYVITGTLTLQGPDLHASAIVRLCDARSIASVTGSAAPSSI